MARRHPGLLAPVGLLAFLLSGCLFKISPDKASSPAPDPLAHLKGGDSIPRETIASPAPEPPASTLADPPDGPPMSVMPPSGPAPADRSPGARKLQNVPLPTPSPKPAPTPGPAAEPDGPILGKSDYHPRNVTPVSRKANTFSEPKPTLAAPLPSLPGTAPEGPKLADPPGVLPPTVTSGQPKPGREESPLLAALRLAMEKHPEEAQQLLHKYDKADRELVIALVKLTAGVGVGDLGKLPPAEVAAALEHLDILNRQLRKRATLSLENIRFCRRIDGFGQYEPMPTGYEFQAGGKDCAGERVQVYVEVRNFAHHLSNGTYETVLDSNLEIHDAERKVVRTMNLGPSVDRSQTPRQDYFLNFRFHVPCKLPPGLYTLWVIVKDVTPGGNGESTTNRVARRSLDFKVRQAAPTIAQENTR